MGIGSSRRYKESHEENPLAGLDADLVRRSWGLGIHQSLSWLEDGDAGEQEGPEAVAARGAHRLLGQAGTRSGAGGQSRAAALEEPQGQDHPGALRLLRAAALQGR